MKQNSNYKNSQQKLKTLKSFKHAHHNHDSSIEKDEKQF